MVGVGGADEAVVADVQRVVHCFEACGVLVGEFFGGLTELLGGGLHLLAVLVGAGHERIEAVEALKRLVRRLRWFVGVADVRVAIGVGDGGGDVEQVAVTSRFTAVLGEALTGVYTLIRGGSLRAGGLPRRMFLRASTQGTRPLGAPPSLLRCGERPCDTPRALRKHGAPAPNIQPPVETKPRQPPTPHTNTSHHATGQTMPASPSRFARHWAAYNHRGSPQPRWDRSGTPNTDTTGCTYPAVAPGNQARKDGTPGCTGVRSEARTGPPSQERGRIPALQASEHQARGEYL